MVVVFDAMMSGMPTHKEHFAGFELEIFNLLFGLNGFV